MSPGELNESEEEEKLLTSDEDYVQVQLQIPSPEEKKEEEGEVLPPHHVGNSSFLTWIKSFPHVGHVLIVVAACANATIGLLVKELDTVDPFVLIAFRGVVISCFAVPYLACNRITPFPRGRVGALLARGVSFVFLTGALYFGFRRVASRGPVSANSRDPNECLYSRYLPLGEVRTLNATQLVFVNLLACCFLSEPCGAAETQTVLVTLLGIVMVTSPPFLFGRPDREDGTIVYDATYYLVASVVVAGAAFEAVAFVACRYLRDVNPNVLSAWGGAVNVASSLPCAWAIGALKELPPMRLMPYVVAIGVLSYLLQVSMIVALQMEEAGAASVVRRALDILLSFFLQVAWFGQVPGTVSLLGSLLITVTVVFEGWRKRNGSQKKKVRY